MVKQITFIFTFLSFLLLYNVNYASAFYVEETFFQEDEDSYFFHTIERGQTVFSIANMYSVSVEDIYTLNPGSENVIKVGNQLKIPQKSGSYIYHTIQPKETLYSLAKRYYMKGEDIISVNPGLSVETFRIGRIIRIPTNRVTTPILGGNEQLNQQSTNSLLKLQEQAMKVPAVKVALLLPFGTNSGDNASSQARFLEYYEGFLLALKDLKRKGISVNLLVYDTGNGTDKIVQILKYPEMQNIHLLIGGLYEPQIKLLSAFSKETSTPYVIPVTSTSNEVLDNENIYQVNTPQSYLYSKASLAFVNKYSRDSQIIIVKDDANNANRSDFIHLLEEDLKQKNISYHTVLQGKTFTKDLTASLSKERNNVVIPSDDSPETLSKLITPVKLITESNPSIQVSLFGYPSWQGYSSEFSDDFFRFNASFYTFFYANPTASEVKAFHKTFYQWFSRNMINMYPKYGMLGYDTGCFFVQMVHTYGVNFAPHINKLNSRGIQTDFHFKRVNNWGGFINTNLYVVDFNPDFTITQKIVE